jgi:DNA mismatch repair protein MutS2
VYIDKEDLDELEFPQLLAEISPFAYSPKTREKILQLRPMEIDEAELSKKTSEYLSSFESSNAIPFDEYEDIESELKLMLIENYRLENSAFIKIKTITEQIGRFRSSSMPETFPTLWKSFCSGIQKRDHSRS